MTFDRFAISEVFQKIYTNLASNLVDKLPAAVNKFGLHSEEGYYKNVLQLQENTFTFQTIKSSSVLRLLTSVEVNKAAGMDNTSGRFLKDGADMLAIPVTQICNLSIKLLHFPNNCRLTKLKPLYKKGSKTDSKNFRPISLLPIVSKIIEKIIHDQTMEYLTDNKILYTLSEKKVGKKWRIFFASDEFFADYFFYRLFFLPTINFYRRIL